MSQDKLNNFLNEKLKQPIKKSNSMLKNIFAFIVLMISAVLAIAVVIFSIPAFVILAIDAVIILLIAFLICLVAD